MKARYASVISEMESAMKTLSARLGKARVKRNWLSRLKRGTWQQYMAYVRAGERQTKDGRWYRSAHPGNEAVKGEWTNPMP